MDVHSALRRIADVLPQFHAQDEQRGLLDGYCGSALFHAYFYRLTGDDDQLDQLNAVILRSVDALARPDRASSHCSGLSGMAWCLQHLVRQGFIDGADDMFEAVDAALFDFAMKDLDAGRLDFLHDGIGAALYFLERLPDPKAREALDQIADRIERVLQWPGDLGLAHGAPAILVVLSLLHDAGIRPIRTASMLRDGLARVRAARNAPEVIAMYPASVETCGTPSRLGWCYGDLAVATAVLRAGASLGDAEVVAHGTAIVHHTLSRTLADGAIRDASLCHGTMGVSHMYRRAYLATGEAAFAAAAERWLDHTLAMASHDRGVAGFTYHLASGTVDRYSVLEGVAGIGLGLIAALDRSTPPAWDRCLLLS